MKEKQLILYRVRDDEEGRLLSDIAKLSEYEGIKGGSRSENVYLLADCIGRLLEFGGKYGFSGNLRHLFLTWILVNHENPYSLGAEVTGHTEGTLNEAALHDLRIFRELFAASLSKYEKEPGGEALSLIEDFRSAGTDLLDPLIREKIENLSETLSKEESASGMKEKLTAFYGEVGVGMFGLHKSFRIEDTIPGQKDGKPCLLRPVTGMTPARFSDLVGLEIQKEKLKTNTEAFLEGRPANNCLLYGDAGTGKSTMVKALANEYHDRGLRIIEIYKHQFRSLNDLLSLIRNRNYRFLLFMDDLSFEEFETEYKYLKAVIEGGLEKRPDNVLIYATSNRRHLIRERFSDRQDAGDDKRKSDTVQEKLSLSGRFGETIYFGSPEKKEFGRIVSELAKRAGIGMPEEELLLAANAWELQHGGLSGRTASQFIDHLLGKKEQ